MPNYRRAWHRGGTYFFTVNLLQRHGNDLKSTAENLELVESAGRSGRTRYLATAILGAYDSRRRGYAGASGIFEFQSGETCLVRRVADWPLSTFHQSVKQGVYPPDWGGGNDISLAYDDSHAAQCPSVISPYVN